MGLGGVSPGSLLLILLIAVVLFGTKKLQSLGEDLGKAFRGFRKALSETTEDPPKSDSTEIK